MAKPNLYDEAHLFTAAVRVLSHLESAPPLADAVHAFIGFSPEHGGLVLKKLIDLGVLEATESPFGRRISIADHRMIETIPKEPESSGLADEVRAFQSSKKDFDKQIEKIQKEREEKKKNLFAEIEKKLGRELGREEE